MPAVPRVTSAQAEGIARAYYGVAGSAERLAAEHDDAFRIVAGDGSARLLKISAEPWLDGDGLAEGGLAEGGLATGGAAGSGGAAGRGDSVSFQVAVLLHLAATAPELPVQRVIPSLDGRPEVSWTEDGHRRTVRMTSWLDGDLLGESAADPGLRREVGATLARLSRALRGFDHPGAHRTHRWDVQRLGELRPLLRDLPESGMLPEVRRALDAGGSDSGPRPEVCAVLDAGGPASGPDSGSGLRTALHECLDRFDAVVAPGLAHVPVQVIHADFHGLNLLSGGGRITGILDFGDALTGPVAMDVAVAACYQLYHPGRGPDVLAPALDVVAGYHAVDPLGSADLELTAEFIVARVVARIIVSQWNALREPANAGYLLRRTPQAVGLLAALRALAPGEIARRLRAACRESG